VRDCGMAAPGSFREALTAARVTYKKKQEKDLARVHPQDAASLFLRSSIHLAKV